MLCFPMGMEMPPIAPPRCLERIWKKFQRLYLNNRPWKTSTFLIICKACYFLSNGIKWEYHIKNILKKYFFKKEYLIEAHYYVKGLFNLHVPDCVKPSSIPKFGLCSEETGSTNQKNLNIQTFPQTPTVRRHQRFCLCIYHLGIFW